MGEKTRLPVFEGRAFDCPYCSVYANMEWYWLQAHKTGRAPESTSAMVALCAHCGNPSFWLNLNPRAGNDQAFMLIRHR